MCKTENYVTCLFQDNDRRQPTFTEFNEYSVGSTIVKSEVEKVIGEAKNNNNASTKLPLMFKTVR